MKRLAKAVDELADDSWDQLSEGTQQWYNKAAEALKDKQAIEDFEPADDDAEADDETAAEAEAEEAEVEAASDKENAKVAKTARIARVSTNGAGADGEKKTRRVASSTRRTSKVRERSERKVSERKSSERKVVRAKPRDGEGPGAPTLIRQLVMDNPEATAKDCREMLEQKGVECTPFTVSSVLAAAKATMRIAKEAGLLKPGFDI